MKKELHLRVIGSHKEIGECEEQVVEVSAQGAYLKKGDNHYLFYDEIHEEGFITKNRIVVIPGKEVQIIKKGAVTSDMSLLLNEKTNSLYQTPYIVMEMGFDTKHIHFKEDETGLTLEVEYIMSVDGVDHAMCKVAVEGIIDK